MHKFSLFYLNFDHFHNFFHIFTKKNSSISKNTLVTLGRWIKRMVRQRQIERLPQGLGGAPCPHLKEYKPLLDVGAALAANDSATCQPRYEHEGRGIFKELCRIDSGR